MAMFGQVGDRGQSRRGQIREYATTVLREWQATPMWGPAKQLRAASFANARDYAGRFLLELLQNAHDAHPGDRTDGRVHILLDERDGPFGTLHVANGGQPFGWDQVEAVCKLAQSAKVIGEGIGNKGVGFRSVLEITTSPEIYSAADGDAGTRRLDGYCFRFADEADLRALLDDEDEARRAAGELPPFQVPYPITGVPTTCSELASAGHVTVIRLPIRNLAAAQSVSVRLTELAAARTPVMLFLSRLQELVLERRPTGGAAQITRLVRAETPTHYIETKNGSPIISDDAATALPAVSIATVDLGTLGPFLVARGRVPVGRLRKALTSATDDDRLDDAWSDWAQPAIVEAALPTFSESSHRGQVYTFLPLGGDVEAPVRGHVNAPFFTKVDRTSLVRDHPLNAMLLEALAETCLLAAEHLRGSVDPKARSAAVDLVAWDPRTASAATLLATAAGRVHGSSFGEAPVVPLLCVGASEKPAWGTPQESVLWPSGDLEVLTAAAAAAVGLKVADPGVGIDRLNRLARTCDALRHPLTPTPSKLADHVEQIVAKQRLPKTNKSGRWIGLYLDLPQIFKDGSVLRGRTLLLADDGTLKPFNSTVAEDDPRHSQLTQEAFFPPERSQAGRYSEIDIPESLQKRLFYVHRGLRWTDNDDQTRRREARLFLEKSGLVRSFNAEELLEHVRLALQSSSAKRFRLQALRFAFRLHRSQAHSKPLRLASVGLYVPSAEHERLIPADEAAFGAGWSGTCGDDMDSVVAEGRGASPDLQWVAERLIAPPAEFVKRGDTVEEWRAFLTELGVTDGLMPIVATNAVKEMNGHELSAKAIAQAAKVSNAIKEQWLPAFRHQTFNARFPRTAYTASGASRLPGQEIATSLGENGRLAYARLILHGLAEWSDRQFTLEWSRWSDSQDPHRIPTPMGAFLHRYPWLPVRSRDRAITFAKPADAWHCPAELDVEPTFAPTVAHQVRPLLGSGNTMARLRNLGLPTWGDRRDSAAQIAALGRLVAAGSIGEDDRPAVQRANEQAWTALVTNGGASALQPLEHATLVAEVDDRLVGVETTRLRQAEHLLYIADDRGNLTTRLIQQSEHPLLVVPGAAADVLRILAPMFPGVVRGAQDANLTVAVDGTPFSAEPGHRGLALHVLLPWMPHAIAVLADHTGSGPRPTDAALADMVRVARDIDILRYTSLEVRLDGSPVVLPQRHGGILPVTSASRTVILAPLAEDGLDWRLAARLSDAVAHAVARPEFAKLLRSATHELGYMHADIANPDDELLAEALQLSPRQLTETARRLNNSVSGVLARCYPLLVHALGTQRAKALATPSPADVRELQDVLSGFGDELPLPAAKLIAIARDARDVDEVRAAAGVDFAALNRTLAGLAPEYQQISHADDHEQAVRAHVDLNRPELINRVRWALLHRFDAREPISDWPDLRSLGWLTAPESWAFTKDVADAETVRSHVEVAIAARLGGSVPTAGPRLIAADQLRHRNNILIRRITEDLIAVIKATRRPLPSVFADPDPATAVAAALESCGALDFRELAERDVIAWLVAVQQWPDGMPATRDLAALGVTPHDLDRERREQDRARDERARRRRMLRVAGHDFDVESGDYTPLLGVLESAFHSGTGRIVGRPRFSTPYAPTASGGSGLPGSRTNSDISLSAVQRSAIGFMGEWFAYQWLRANYPESNESSWVSTNRRNVYPGEAGGDDTLGFDFRVGSGKLPLMFEVKATQGEGGQVELGESEVRAAERFSGNDRWRILVITSVLEPAKASVAMLPNPFSARGRGAYRRDGGAVRFSYRL